jgi:hypothetical protein
MFEKFTERARKVMSLSRQEAQNRNSEFIGTENVMIAILREDGGVAAKVLKRLGMTLMNVVPEIDKIVPTPTTPPVTLGQIPFTPRVKRVIEIAGEEASKAAHDVVGTEHLLLGLFIENEGVTGQVFGKFDVTEHRLRKELRDVLGDDAGRIVPGLRAPVGTSIRITLFRPLEEGSLGSSYLIVRDVKYSRYQTLTLEGVPAEKVESMAKSVAENMGCSVYTVDPA